MLQPEIKSKIRRLWDKFWSGGISNPLQAIEQISYLLFMKHLEGQDNKEQFNAKLRGEEYNSLFQGKIVINNQEINKSECKWSVWTQYPGNKMLEHVRNKVFPFLKTIGGEESLYNEYMNDAQFTLPTSSLLIEAVKIINELRINDQNKDVQGEIYEYLLSELKSAGKNGQFRTPRHIIKMIVELVNPEYGNTICDPACGTAGFLINAYEHILKKNTSKELIKTDEKGNQYNFVADQLDKNKLNILRNSSLYGFDFDPVMVRITIMNLIMHGIEKPNIKQMNTLSTRYNETNYYDIILANPPFKGSINESELNKEFTIKTKKTELLFVELIYRLLTRGGKCGIILPDGVLFGSSKAHKAVRKLLLEKCNLQAVISMPSGVFKPYAGVSTAVLIFQKGEPTKRVWFYKMENDGYTLDDKRTEIEGSNIPDIIERFKNRDKEKNDDRKAQHFFVPVEEIIKNDYDLSISKYKEIEYEEVHYKPSKEIKEKIIELEKKILEQLNDLKL